MIQDIYPHKLHNEYRPEAKPESSDYVVNKASGYTLMDKEAVENGKMQFPMVSDFTNQYQLTYLFTLDEKRFFLLRDKLPENEIPAGFKYYDEEIARSHKLGPQENVFISVTAKHLADWYTDVQYCGRCGAKMHHSQIERAMTCPDCSYTAYPRIMPAVIVGVINENKLLVTRYRVGTSVNALIAGFVEIGETAEETVAREVMEETGVRVKNIRYYKSQPWGMANDILLGYFCDLDGEGTITMDKSELKFAEWIDRESIELQPSTFSLTNEMMTAFKENKVPVL